MSIRELARELYRLQREIETLEGELTAAAPESRTDIEEKLLRTRAERERVRKLLEQRKEKPPYRRPL